MTPSLERLAELVRQAEAKTRAKKLGTETQQAAAQFRAAEQRVRVAAQRLREVRPTRLRDLEQADTEEHYLKDLVRKLAQFKSSLESDSDAEALVATAQAEIERKRREAKAELETVGQESEETRRALRAAMEHYLQLRREIDRLQPQLAENFAAEDRLLWDAEMHFPGGQFQALARGRGQHQLLRCARQARTVCAVEDLDWPVPDAPGGQRRRADRGEPGAGEARVFHQLKALSKQYEPGYIEAFRHDYNTDWAAYIAEAQEQLLQATEAARRNKDWEQQRLDQQAREQERHQQTRETGQVALEELKALLARTNLPDEGVDEFLAQLKLVVNGLGASDPQLLELVMPYRELVAGGNGLRA